MNMTIETNITKMLGIKYPIISAPMGPFYTTELTAAVSEAGGLGVLSHTNLEGKSSWDEMKANIEYVLEHTDKPFGLNIRTSRMQPDATQLCRQVPRYINGNPKAKEQIKYILTSAGTSKMLGKSRHYIKLKEESPGIYQFHVAPALWLAQKCVDNGVDGLVVTGGEGGGHQSFERVSTLVLMQQIKKALPDTPVVGCGGFATGEGMAAALAMGAGAIAMGTRFIASKESEFHESYKGVIPSAKAQDTELKTGVLGPIRLWKNKYCLEHDLVANKEEKMAEEKSMTAEDLMATQKAYELVYHGDIVNGAVLLGQSEGLVHSIDSVSDIIETIMKDAEKAIRDSAACLK